MSPSSCNADETQFKGIFMRNLFYLYRVDHSQAYLRFIQTNADSKIWADDRNSQNHFGVVGGAVRQGGRLPPELALDALNAALPVSPIPAPATAGLSTTQVRVTPGGSGATPSRFRTSPGRTSQPLSPSRVRRASRCRRSRPRCRVGAGDASNVSLQVSAASGTPQNFYRVAIDVKSAGMALPTRYLTESWRRPKACCAPTTTSASPPIRCRRRRTSTGSDSATRRRPWPWPASPPVPRSPRTAPLSTWPSASPGYPDNIVAGGQTVPVEAPAGTAQIGFLGAAAGGPSLGQLTLNYSDGSSSHFELPLSRIGP